MKVAIRVDASYASGTGHVMRCQTLARELVRKGAEVVFVQKKQKGDLIGLLAHEFDTRILKSRQDSFPTKSIFRGTETPEKYIDKDPNSAEELRIFKELQPDWLIVDRCGLDLEWEQQVRLIVKNILVIDDLTDRKHDADILVNPNDYGPLLQNHYQKLVNDNCELLLGPHFSMIGEEYAEIRHSQRIRDGSVRRLLIFFGGSDLTKQTLKTIRALTHLDFNELIIDVIVGRNNLSRSEIESEMQKLPNAMLHECRHSLASLITRADLAVGAAGSALWERCCLGLPSLIISTAPNQLGICRELSKRKLIRYLGPSNDVSINDLRLTLSKYVDSPELTKTMSRRTMGITDGLGASRIVTAMGVPIDRFLFRPLSVSDEYFYSYMIEEVNKLELESNDKNRGSERYGGRFFANLIKDKETRYLVGETNNGLPVGLIRYQKRSGSSYPYQTLIDKYIENKHKDIATRFSNSVKHYVEQKFQALEANHVNKKLEEFRKNTDINNRVSCNVSTGEFEEIDFKLFGVAKKRQQFWEKRGGLGLSAGTNDINLKKLEIHYLSEMLAGRKNILDAGCGNGITAVNVLKTYGDAELVGFDYAPAMVFEANELAKREGVSNRANFYQQELSSLNLSNHCQFDAIYTERSLINLDSFESQKYVVASLAENLKHGGILLICESFLDGLEEINSFRKKLGLSLLEPPWHNTYLRMEDLTKLVPAGLEIKQVVNFSSTYYFLSRVVNAWVAQSEGKEPTYDAPINKIAFDLPLLDVCAQTKLIVIQ